MITKDDQPHQSKKMQIITTMKNMRNSKIRDNTKTGRGSWESSGTLIN